MVLVSSNPERCACGVVRSGLDLKGVLAFPSRQLTVQFLCRRPMFQCKTEEERSYDLHCCLACFGMDFVFSLLNH